MFVIGLKKKKKKKRWCTGFWTMNVDKNVVNVMNILFPPPPPPLLFISEIISKYIYF